jgi:DNA-binding transcriptional ArsR family regulator
MKHGLALTRQVISQHLDVLESAGLVKTRREGRYKLHYLNTDPLKAIVATAVLDYTRGNPIQIAQKK